MLNFKSTIFHNDITQFNHAIDQCELTNLGFRMHFQYKKDLYTIFFNSC
jgi:hypothetical protein